MVSQFCIELEEEDKLLYLVQVMEALTGSVHCHPAVLIEVDQPEIGQALERIFNAALRSYHVIWTESAEDGPGLEEPVIAAAVVGQNLAIENPESPAEGKICEICGAPVEKLRSTICNKDECRKARQRKYQAQADAKRKTSQEWFLAATGETYSSDALKLSLERRELMPGTLLHKRSGQRYTVSANYELKDAAGLIGEML
jgi:hypothetical protein